MLAAQEGGWYGKRTAGEFELVIEGLLIPGRFLKRIGLSLLLSLSLSLSLFPARDSNET